MTRKPMTVRVPVTVTIDPDAWTANYGVEARIAIRQDVEAYVTNLVTEQLREVGVLAREEDR